MNCPKCKNPSKVIDSRKKYDTTMRLRECLNCGHHFTSIEILYDEKQRDKMQKKWFPNVNNRKKVEKPKPKPKKKIMVNAIPTVEKKEENIAPVRYVDKLFMDAVGHR
jgi:transcriptional regulator NrdR family protein